MDVSPLIRQKYNLKVNDDIESLYDEGEIEGESRKENIEDKERTSDKIK